MASGKDVETVLELEGVEELVGELADELVDELIVGLFALVNETLLFTMNNPSPASQHVALFIPQQ